MSRKNTQIGQQLHQGGITSAQAQAISRWLGQVSVSPPREIGPNSPEARDPAWINQFIPPEESPRPLPGEEAGDNGIGPNVEGDPNFDDTLPNFPGSPAGGGGGTTIINRPGTNIGFNPVDLRPLIASITRLEELVSRLMLLPELVNRLQRNVIRMQGEINRNRRRIEDLEERVEAIEEELRNAIACPFP